MPTKPDKPERGRWAWIAAGWPSRRGAEFKPVMMKLGDVELRMLTGKTTHFCKLIEEPKKPDWWNNK